MRVRTRKKLEHVRKKRLKGQYKTIGLFFLAVGAVCVLFAIITYPLFCFGIIFKENPYIAPIPSQKDVQGVATHHFDQTSELASELAKNELPYDTIQGVNGGYDVKLTSGEEVIFSADKDIASQISSLQLIQSRLKIEDRRFSRLDFRYEKPVITFTNAR